ncbi:MAG: N-acetyltransferase family protein [Eubacteriales bacterium]
MENHPLYVAEIDGSIAGYASLSSYQEKEAYRSTVELSIYIAPAFRKRGAATELMAHISRTRKRMRRTHTVVSVITSGNEASRKLHKKFGFEFCGTIRVGMKFGCIGILRIIAWGYRHKKHASAATGWHFTAGR